MRASMDSRRPVVFELTRSNVLTRITTDTADKETLSTSGMMAIRAIMDGQHREGTSRKHVAPRPNSRLGLALEEEHSLGITSSLWDETSIHVSPPPSNSINLLDRSKRESKGRPRKN